MAEMREHAKRIMAAGGELRAKEDMCYCKETVLED
jgi:hypothetical protein